ncbi:MAG: PadR family transcriptional regulator [Acidobacteriota bacterium]
MPSSSPSPPLPDANSPEAKLILELRRGCLVLATLSQLKSPQYGYSLLQELAQQGLEVEQGTLYPLLRRLAKQGLLSDEWLVEGPRPRKYYRLNDEGHRVLASLTNHWQEIVQVMEGLLADPAGD